MRLAILFLVALFGAYSQYRAEKIVEQKKAEEKKMMQQKMEIKKEHVNFYETCE